MARRTMTVNGRTMTVDVSPHVRLLDYLRQQGLTGAKEGCAEGECGACAVLVARPDGEERTRWTAVNACLPPALAYEGQETEHRHRPLVDQAEQQQDEAEGHEDRADGRSRQVQLLADRRGGGFEPAHAT